MNLKEVKTAEITVDYVCNQNCLFCSIGHLRKDLKKSTEDVFRDIDEAKKKGASILGFGGGEPTIRKDIFQIIRYAKSKNFPTIRIQTNGLMLSNDKYVEKILKAGANFFKFSIHSHIPEIHDKLTQVKGSFEKAIKGIENLKKRGYSVEVDIVINKLNYKFLPQFVEFFISKGISKFCFVYVTYEGNARKYKEKINVNITKVIPYLKEAIEIVKLFDLDKNLIFNVPFCFIEDLKHETVENVEFNTFVFTPSSIIDIDMSKLTDRVKPSVCRPCKFYKECIGPKKDYVENYGVKDIHPVIDN